jgi:hypothetical protein
MPLITVISYEFFFTHPLKNCAAYFGTAEAKEEAKEKKRKKKKKERKNRGGVMTTTVVRTAASSVPSWGPMY